MNRLHIRYEPRVGTKLPKPSRITSEEASGLHEVRHVDDVVEFVFLNEVHVRFGSVDSFNVYPHPPYDDDLRNHDVTELQLSVDDRFERVIDNLLGRNVLMTITYTSMYLEFSGDRLTVVAIYLRIGI